MPSRHTSVMLLVVFVLLVLACAAPVPPAPPPPPATQQNNPPGPENPPPVVVPNAPPIRDPAKEKADIVWTAAELRKETKANGLNFRRKYKDKIIEVSGKLWDFEPFAYYGPNKLIDVQIEAKPVFVIVHMADREPWAKAVPGQDITIRGRVPRDEDFINEPLMDCIIVEPQQSSALQLTAEHLCGDARADPKKYNQMYMIVSGEVVSKGKPGLTIVELKGDAQTKVRCQVYGKLSLTTDPLKVGQKIKMFGQYVTFDKANGVILDKALPIIRNAE